MMTEQPMPESSPSDDQPLGPPPVAPRKPRIWTALVVPVAVVFVATILSGIILIVGILITNPAVRRSITGSDETFDVDTAISDFFMTPGGLVAMLFPQALFFAVAVCAGLMSRTASTLRLGLLKPKISILAVVAVIVATPFFGTLGSLLMSLTDAPSSSVELLEKMFVETTGPMVVFMVIGIGVLPGVAEEFLFRGYVQRRLLQRWNPMAAISVSTLLFAGAHVEPAHAMAVIPLGLWLGTVVWLSGSIWPSIACHAANNLVAIVLVRTTDVDVVDNTWNTPSIVLVSVSGFAVLCSLLLMRRDLRVRSSDTANALQQNVSALDDPTQEEFDSD